MISPIQGRDRWLSLQMSVIGVLLMVAAVSAISLLDPTGASFRVAMIVLTIGAGIWLSWRQLAAALPLVWLGPNAGRSLLDDAGLLTLPMALEGIGLAAIAFLTVAAKRALHSFDDEEVEGLFGDSAVDTIAGLNPETGIFRAHQLKPSLQAELARSRRFRRTFALVLVGVDEMRQKFDFRDEAEWQAGLDATTRLLRETRQNVDRVYHYKDSSFAIILPEAREKDIPGLVRRLRRLARSMDPPEGQPGGPLPVHFGATFFPDCATTVHDLLHRAEVALRLAAGSTSRYQIDSAEAPEPPPPETLRRNAVAWAGAVTGPQTTASPDAVSGAAEGHRVTASSAEQQAGAPSDVQHNSATSGQAEDVETVLARMRETLAMIRSARNPAA